MVASRKKQREIPIYDEKKYDRIEIRVLRGRKNEIHVHAASRGESLSAFCKRAIDNQMLRD